MHFLNYKILFLIWIIPILFLIAFWGINKKKKVINSFLSYQNQTVLLKGFSLNRLFLKYTIKLTIILLIIVSLSGPLVGYSWREVNRKGVDIIIALDCSKSMLARDIKPSRLQRAKREIVDLINMLEGDRVGLVIFAGVSFLQCPLTLDYEAFYIFLDSISPDNIPLGGTNLYEALKTSKGAFKTKDITEKAIILITDGEMTEGENIDEVAKKLMEDNIKVFTIGVGNKEGVPILDKNGGFKKDSDGNVVLTKIDEEVLQRISAITGGVYVRSVAGDMDLDSIYKKEIRGKMKREKFESGKKKIWNNRFQYPLFIALLLFIIDFLLFSKKSKESKKTKKGVFTVLVLFAFFLSFSFVLANASVYSEAKESYKKKEYDIALQKFITMQLEDPNNLELFYNIGNCYYKLGNYDAAEKNFKKSLESNNKGLKANSLYNLGNVAYRNGDYETAIKRYEEALKIAPDDKEAKENIEFIKRLQKQQKNQCNKKSDKQNDKKNDRKQKKGSGKKKNEVDKNSKKQKQNEAQKNKQNKPKNDKQNKQSKPKPEKTKKQEAEKQNMKQAKESLKKIKEKLPPTQLLFPNYEDRNVDKDW